MKGCTASPAWLVKACWTCKCQQWKRGHSVPSLGPQGLSGLKEYNCGKVSCRLQRACLALRRPVMEEG